jgi:probable addiction module antidote protein
MKTSTRPFDAAAYLKNVEALAAYMPEAHETGDPAFITDAISVIARARGMTQVAKDAGLSRERLYGVLSADGNPEFATILKVVDALGLKLSALARDGAGMAV